MKKTIPALSIFLALSIPWVYANGSDARLNLALTDAVSNSDFASVQVLLSQGADPNAQFPGDLESNPMCVATRPGKLELLKALINAGGDSNNLADGYASFFSAPLSCAISYGNYEAFVYLLDSGADIELNLCSVCTDLASGTSVLQTAVDSFEYRMSWELIKRGARDQYAIAGMISQIERISSEDLNADPHRQKLIQWLRDEGYEVNLKASENEQ